MFDRLKYGHTLPIENERGEVVPGHVATIERVMLGGVEQSIVIRGRDTSNPILLYLHGGQGMSELGMLRTYNLPVLERHFTVVVREQRGAAQSFAARIPASGMTVEQLVADTCELVELLCQRFSQPQGRTRRALLGERSRGARGEQAPRTISRLRRGRPGGEHARR